MTNIKKIRKPKKLPTSQLAFYMTYPILAQEVGLSEEIIEEIFFWRVTKNYGLYPDMARNFLEREQMILQKRGDYLDSYYFGQLISVKEALTIFCANTKENSIGNAILWGDNFHTLTMSEMVSFYKMFLQLRNTYQWRQKNINRILANNESTKKQILKGNGSIEEKTQEIHFLEEEYSKIFEQEELERKLLGMNRMLVNCMYKKLGSIMGYQSPDEDKQAMRTFMKEFFLIPTNKKVQGEIKTLYRDLSDDIVKRDLSLIQKYNPETFKIR